MSPYNFRFISIYLVLASLSLIIELMNYSLTP